MKTLQKNWVYKPTNKLEFIENSLGNNTRVGIVLIHLEQNTIMIESLGHDKRFRTLGKIRFKD